MLCGALRVCRGASKRSRWPVVEFRVSVFPLKRLRSAFREPVKAIATDKLKSPQSNDNNNSNHDDDGQLGCEQFVNDEPARIIDDSPCATDSRRRRRRRRTGALAA